MWKKALSVYNWLYIAVMVIGIGYNAYIDISSGEFQPVSLILPLVIFLPAAVIHFGLKGRKVSILLTLLGLLIIAVPVLGMFNFDGFTLATIGKALLFVPMLAGLIYFGYMRLFGNK